jgi:glycosyltransferase involved in cell wall biosynthesis
MKPNMIALGPGRRIVMLLSNSATHDQRPLREGHALSRAGYSVKILAWDRDGDTKRDATYSDGLTVIRMRLRAGHGTPLQTVPRLLIFWAWCIFRLVPLGASAVHCHDVDTLPAGFVARKLGLGKRLVYDMHDIPEAFLRFFPLTRLLQGAILSASRRLVDIVVVASDAFPSFLRSVGCGGLKTAVVLNSPRLAEGRQPRERRGKFRILYYGGLEEERGVRQLVEAVKGMDGVELLFAGRGTLSGWLKESERADRNVRLLGWLSIPELTSRIRDADLIPSLYDPSFLNIRLSVPGKFLTAISLSVPVLVPSGTHQGTLAREFGCGIVAAWNDTGETRRAIASLAEDPVLYGSMARSAYGAFRAQFNWEMMEYRLLDSYRVLIG